jgi:hypothetical protein
MAEFGHTHHRRGVKAAPRDDAHHRQAMDEADRWILDGQVAQGLATRFEVRKRDNLAAWVTLGQ